MPVVVTYASEPSELRPYVLTDDELRGLGRLIRACAEIEDIIDLYLYRLADISEGAGKLLLGRVPASARLNMIEAFAKSHGPEPLKLYRLVFDNEHYRAIVR